jgi:RNA polymerase-binding transcription factor DksA
MRVRLQLRRRELFVLRRGLDESWTRLHERDVELEENAQKEHMSQPADALDRQEVREIEAIDDALRRLSAGSYGICVSCGREISRKRLEALPWAAECIECASGGELVEEPEVLPAAAGVPEMSPLRPREEPAAAADRAPEAGLPPDFQGLDSESLNLALLDHLSRDTEIDLEEVSFGLEGGTLVLLGEIPSREEHEELLAHLSSNLGFPSIEDNLRETSEPWEREDRTTDKNEETFADAKDDETLLYGESLDQNEDVHAAQKDGTPFSPPDHLTPEKG